MLLWGDSTRTPARQISCLLPINLFEQSDCGWGRPSLMETLCWLTLVVARRIKQLQIFNRTKHRVNPRRILCLVRIRVSVIFYVLFCTLHRIVPVEFFFFSLFATLFGPCEARHEGDWMEGPWKEGHRWTGHQCLGSSLRSSCFFLWCIVYVSAPCTLMRFGTWQKRVCSSTTNIQTCLGDMDSRKSCPGWICIWAHSVNIVT